MQGVPASPMSRVALENEHATGGFHGMARRVSLASRFVTSWLGDSADMVDGLGAVLRNDPFEVVTQDVVWPVPGPHLRFAEQRRLCATAVPSQGRSPEVC